MAKFLALPRLRARELQLEVLRTAIVCGCALALIGAGKTLPF